MRQLGFVFSAASPEAAVEPSIRGQVRVERVLRQHLGPKVIVALTDNRSTMISFKERRGVLYVRLHAIFADADSDLLASVGSFVRGRASKRQARMIDEWIEANRHLIKRPREDDPPLLPVGECYDLQAIYDELNTTYFEEKIVARITWTRALRNQKRTTIRMGSYCDEQKLIRIHPALDQPFVPEYFVAWSSTRCSTRCMVRRRTRAAAGACIHPLFWPTSGSSSTTKRPNAGSSGTSTNCSSIE
jgi:hypothetical protein